MELTQKDIKEIVLHDDCIQITTQDGDIGKEYFADYPRLKNAGEQARKDYTVSNFGLHWEDLDEDLGFTGFFKPKRQDSEIGRLFSELEEINLSSFARKMGIAQPLLADYISGKKKPSVRRRKEIMMALQNLGERLLSVAEPEAPYLLKEDKEK
ncbi:MAG: DUF2442 domain-containing protein [Chitinophagales bacterium]|nr:DUF2442 domain-containing protein [Chitinophagales bacterium]